jgi:hypothetical protein
MLGFFTTLRSKHKMKGCATDRYEHNEVYAGWSRDGFHFAKAALAQRRPLLSLSEHWPSWRHGDVQSVGGGMLVVGDLLHIYGSGSNGKACNKAPGSSAAAAAAAALPKPKDACRNVSSTGRAVLRRDGFASITTTRL